MLWRPALGVLMIAAALSLQPSPSHAQTAPPAAEAPAGAEVPADEAAAAEAKKAADEKAAEAKAAEEAKRAPPDVGTIATLLAAIFALAAVLEAALAVIFAWPVFLDRINRRNTKMPISLAVGFVVAWGFELNLVNKLGVAFGAGSGGLPLWFDSLISALLLAGGAAGVRNLMVSLGLAMPTAELERPPLPQSDKAWLSMRDARADRSGPLTIWLRATAPEAARREPFIVGSIAGGTKTPKGLARIFLPDKSRFPVVAGYAVDVGTTYDIYVQQEKGAPAVGSANWKDYSFGEKAIVDLTFP